MSELKIDPEQFELTLEKVTQPKLLRAVTAILDVVEHPSAVFGMVCIAALAWKANTFSIHMTAIIAIAAIALPTVLRPHKGNDREKSRRRALSSRDAVKNTG